MHRSGGATNNFGGQGKSKIWNKVPLGEPGFFGNEDKLYLRSGASILYKFKFHNKMRCSPGVCFGDRIFY